jgi:hypothetical protein
MDVVVNFHKRLSSFTLRPKTKYTVLFNPNRDQTTDLPHSRPTSPRQQKIWALLSQKQKHSMVVLKFYGPSLHGISIITLQMGWTINCQMRITWDFQDQLFLIINLFFFFVGPFTRPHPGIWRIVFGKCNEVFQYRGPC